MLTAGLLAGCSAADVGVEAGVAQPATPGASSSTPSDSDASAPGPVGEPGPDGAPRPYDPGPIAWEEFDDGIDRAQVVVPVDYAEPEGATISLNVMRFRALDPNDRIGSLLVNPGGPGAAGTDLARFAAYQFDRPLLEHFDIVGWDPRGAEASEPAIDCIDDADYDRLYGEIDSTPDTAAERTALIEAARTFAEGCAANSQGILEFVGTNNSARDIDSIRRALGEDQISFFGFSYGSELGAAWATLYPDTVRAIVIDGASDPGADQLEASLQQTAGFEQSIVAFLDQCADEGCQFAGNDDPDTEFLELMERLDESPVPSEPGRPPVNRAVATQAVVMAMYDDRYWPALDRSLAAAADGDGSGLLELYDAYYRRDRDGTYSNLLEAFQAISCADIAERTTVDDDDANVELFVEAAPHLVPDDSVGGYFCTFFPPARDPRFDITGAGAGPIAVIGTSGDPATPFESTVAMAAALEDGRLVEVAGNRHLAYPSGNGCVLDLVNRYLVDLEAPDDGTVCD